jgi:hypothetical protein
MVKVTGIRPADICECDSSCKILEDDVRTVSSAVPAQMDAVK